MPKHIDITNQKFGKLLVKERAESNLSGLARWLCLCDCGNSKIINGHSLRVGATKSCGCLVRERNSLTYGQAAYNQVLNSYKNNARKKKIEWELSKEDFENLVKNKCNYCGIEPLNIGKSTSKFTGNCIYNGIDRIDSSKGYIIDNVVSCCTKCNYMKNRWSREEFLVHINKIWSNQHEL